jgi:hypothetical protein
MSDFLGVIVIAHACHDLVGFGLEQYFGKVAFVDSIVIVDKDMSLKS